MQRFSNGRLAKVMVVRTQFMSDRFVLFLAGLTIGLSLTITHPMVAQSEAADPETIARSIMSEVRYAGLTTLDSLGYPYTRTMDALPPDSLFQVWMATNPLSRKVRQLQQNQAVSLYYPQHEKGNYVNLTGHALLVDDPNIKMRLWNEDWAKFYASPDDMILIRVEPICLELVSYEHGIISETLDWRAPTIQLKQQK